MGKLVGIDLGTTNSVVATIDAAGVPQVLRNSDGDNITPSVVLFDGADVTVGKQAKRMAAKAPDDVVQFVKRQMGNPDWRYVGSDDHHYRAEEISAIILRRVAADAAIVLGEPVTDAFITVPAYFDDAQRTATRQAGEIAGLHVTGVINEPTAAAVSFGIESGFTGTVLVYDLGGGTFDVTLLDCQEGLFNIRATEGDRNLGGFDFDNAIIRWAREQFLERTGIGIEDDLALADLRERAEDAKHRLSTKEQAQIHISHQGRTEKLELTRKQFEEITRSLMVRTEYLMEGVVETAGLKMPQVDKVLLVGGSTRMPMVWSLVERVAGRSPDRSAHPDEAVARGAAIVADVRSADAAGTARQTIGASNTRIVDVTAHGMGVLAYNQQDILANSLIVPANASVPAQFEREYTTRHDRQTEIEVTVTQGDDENPKYVKTIGGSTLRIPPYPAGAPVRVRFSYDLDATLHVEVRDLTAGRDLKEFLIDRVANLKQEEVDRMQIAIAKLSIQ
jgi:molecular chaperone DnaK